MYASEIQGVRTVKKYFNSFYLFFNQFNFIGRNTLNRGGAKVYF